MNYIKSLHIEGFKKFVSLDVQFNERMNILVGENEAGKSTILDALKTVLNQQYRNTDKSVLRDLFNTQMVAVFKEKPSVKTLPRIYIEVELALDPQQKDASYFYGEVYGQRKQQFEKYGIRFECKYDEELGTGMEQSIQEGKIPYEYYALTWTTFSNRPYQIIKRPLHFLAIDTTSSAAAPSFNYFNRTVFASRYDGATKAKAKNDFRDKPNFNTEDSFYANKNGTNIVIYVSTNQPASLFIVPETYKKVVEFSPDEYGEYITRLLNLVQSQFPSADAFIDDFLKVKE